MSHLRAGSARIVRDRDLEIYDEQGHPIWTIPGNFDQVLQCGGDKIVASQKNSPSILTFQLRNGNWCPVPTDSAFRAPPKPIPRPTGPNVSRVAAAAMGAAGGVVAAHRDRKQSNGAGAIVAAIAIGAVVLNTPGMMITAALRSWLWLDWAPPVMWLFSTAASALVLGGFFAFTRNLWKASALYGFLCLVTLGAFFFCQVGLKSEFTADAILRFFPRLGVAAPSDKPDIVDQRDQHQDPARPKAAPTLHATPSSSAPKTYQVTELRAGDFLNLRKGPGSNYPALTRLSANQRGIVLSGPETPNGRTIWQLVYVNGMTGWANKEFLTSEKP